MRGRVLQEAGAWKRSEAQEAPWVGVWGPGRQREGARSMVP